MKKTIVRLCRLAVRVVLFTLATVRVVSGAAAQTPSDRPNVLWLTCEDMSPDMGCYDDNHATTPVLDRLAEDGVRYTQAIGICGVCAVNRSCLITGMYSSSIGSQDMRSRIRLPDSIPTYSRLLRDAGYYCTNNSKTDYNFATPAEAWDECSRKAHWRNRRPGQPFFAVFNYTGTHESQIWEENHRRHANTLSEYEMHRRAKDSTQYAVGQSQAKYPLRRILPVARLASRREPGTVEELVALLDDQEPVVRWWATLGLVMRGEKARSAQAELEDCLQDDSPLVRVAAAEALHQVGETDQALAALTQALEHDTPFVRLRALNVLYHMGEDARPAIPAVKKAAIKGIYPATYANRMVDYLPGEL